MLVIAHFVNILVPISIIPPRGSVRVQDLRVSATTRSPILLYQLFFC